MLCAGLEKALDFSVLIDARPWIETMPLARAFDAYQKMKSGDVKLLMVLVLNDHYSCHTRL